jgi:two-component system sensor histidine kinase/response regulator
VEGLDAAAGLRRVGGNRDLYVTLLRQFAQNETDALVELKAALAVRDYGAAGRIAHTVRGVAGNVGFSKLHEAAASLEEAIQARHRVDEAAAHFQDSLSRCLAALGTVAAARESGPVAGAAVLSTDELLALSALLERSDGGAVDYLLENRAKVRAVFPPGLYEPFEKAVTEFDFEAALKQLRRGTARQRAIPLERSA